MLIDSGYFERYTNAASVESLIRIVSVNDFRIPETSMRVIAENSRVVSVLEAINSEIKKYNGRITDFRQKRNKYFLTLYKVPDSNEMPDIITSTVNLEGVLPNAQLLNNYGQNITLLATKKTNITIEAKSKSSNIKITKKEPNQEVKKINITKKINHASD